MNRAKRQQEMIDYTWDIKEAFKGTVIAANDIKAAAILMLADEIYALHETLKEEFASGRERAEVAQGRNEKVLADRIRAMERGRKL